MRLSSLFESYDIEVPKSIVFRRVAEEAPSEWTVRKSALGERVVVMLIQQASTMDIIGGIGAPTGIVALNMTNGIGDRGLLDVSKVYFMYLGEGNDALAKFAFHRMVKAGRVKSEYDVGCPNHSFGRPEQIVDYR